MRTKIFLSILGLLLFGGLVYSYVGQELWWNKPKATASAQVFEIKKGESLDSVGARLLEGKFIDNNFLFRQYLKLNNSDKKIQTGIFYLKPGDSISDLTGIITSPQLVNTKILFKEGDTIEDFLNVLEENGFKFKEYGSLSQSDLLYKITGEPGVDYRKSGDSSGIDLSAGYDFLKDKPSYVSLEGYLFPDTYFLKDDMNSKSVVEMLLNNFDKKLTVEMRQEIARQGKTVFEVVTMASLIEAEARTEDDRKIVSDILWRRLSMGMPLQLDSTVNYVTKAGKAAISLNEQKIDSPYNTYKYAGLPLGPINNPGISAIGAAIYPEKNDYLYFLTDPDGNMHYAKTLAEHNLNKSKYLK